MTLAQRSQRRAVTRHVFGNFGWLLIGTLIFAASQWATMSTIAKLGTPALVGQYAFALAFSAPVFMLANLQLRSVAATDVNLNTPVSVYLKLRATTSVAFLLCCPIAAALIIDDASTAIIASLMVLSRALDSVSDLVYGFLQRVEVMWPIGATMIFVGVGSWVGVTLGLLVFNSLVIGVGIGTCASFVTLGALTLIWRNSDDCKRGSASAGKVPARSVLALARRALPLGIVMALISVTANVPRYALQATSGPEAVGIYSALIYLVVGLSMIVNSAGQALTPMLARTFERGSTLDFRRWFTVCVGSATLLGIAMTASVFVWGEGIIEALYASEYAESSPLIALVALGGACGFVSSALGYCLTAAQIFVSQAVVFVGVAAVCIVMAIVLVPPLGLIGAGITYLIAGIAQVAGFGYLALRVLGQLSARGTPEVTELSKGCPLKWRMN